MPIPNFQLFSFSFKIQALAHSNLTRTRVCSRSSQVKCMLLTGSGKEIIHSGYYYKPVSFVLVQGLYWDAFNDWLRIEPWFPRILNSSHWAVMNVPAMASLFIKLQTWWWDVELFASQADSSLFALWSKAAGLCFVSKYDIGPKV